MKYLDAFAIATDWLRKLQPYCDRIEIGGSIRRKQMEVKDIEIVCLPKVVTATDLFAGTRTIRHPGFAQTLQDQNILTVRKGNAHYGRYTQVYLESPKINMDVFIANHDNYGIIKLIRTGDKDFTKKFIGHVLPWYGYKSEDGYLKTKDGETVACTDEEMLFEICKMKFIKPENRQINAI